MEKNFETSFTGWAFILAAVLLWFGCIASILLLGQRWLLL
jgi:hypothetical protein